MKVSWDDEEVNDGFGSNIDRFRVVDGYKDLIRIISDPIKYFVHPIDYKPYYIGCNKENGDCPACDEGMARKQRIGCLIVHIATKQIKGKGKWERVGRVKPWLFAGSRWFDLQQVLEDYQEVKKKGLKKSDLFITCKDEEFQDMIISPTLQESKLEKDMLADHEEAKEKLDFYTGGYDPDKQREILGLDDVDIEESEKASDVAVDFEKDKDEIDVEETEEVNDNEVDDILDDIGDVPF